VTRKPHDVEGDHLVTRFKAAPGALLVDGRLMSSEKGQPKIGANLSTTSIVADMLRSNSRQKG